MKQVPDQNNDEIDLVNILIVLFKRKWLIITLVIVVFILSSIYDMLLLLKKLVHLFSTLELTQRIPSSPVAVFAE